MHVQDGMTDLYILSRCKSVVSCKGTSFGKMASHIGDNKYINIDNPDSKKGIDLPSDYSGEFKGVIKSWAVGMTLSPRKRPTHNETLRSAKLAGFDKALKRFRYHDALDAALADGSPEVVVSVVEELVQDVVASDV